MSLSTCQSHWKFELQQRLYAEMQPSLRSLENAGVPLNPFRIPENKIVKTAEKVQSWIEENCPSSLKESTQKSENVFTLTKIALDGILQLAIQKIRPDIYKDIQCYSKRLEFDENDLIDRTTTELESDIVEISEPKVQESKYQQQCWEDSQLARWYKNPSLFWKN